jgi:triacylglycerol lipase
MRKHRLFFAPGMFGFGRLASYDYFAHVERALEKRIEDAGDVAESFVVDTAPTASVRKRAARMAELVSQSLVAHDDDGPIHLIGHSTGGLDARLVASPDVRLPAKTLAWLPRLSSVTTINTPHYGTPLASFFATVSGQRMLYAVSALTYIGLSVGAPPLAAASALVMAIGRIDHAIGLEIRVMDRAVDSLLRVLDDARSTEVRTYLDAIMKDQGAVLQASPEAMDLFQSCTLDRPDVRYQSTVSMAPPPSPTRWARSLLKPWSALSASLFATLHGITARLDPNYPCALPDAGEQAEQALAAALGRTPGARANDGVVPVRSQIWGEVVWAGIADHLDVLGHFDGGGDHVDWLTSGSEFDRRGFDALMDAIAKGLLAG